MNSPARSFKNINWESKIASSLFMLLSALAANLPIVKDWLMSHTSLDMATITVVCMLIGYFAKAFAMPTQPLPITK